MPQPARRLLRAEVAGNAGTIDGGTRSAIELIGSIDYANLNNSGTIRPNSNQATLRASTARTLINSGTIENSGTGAAIEVEESVSGMRRVIAQANDSHNGKFLNYTGEHLSW